MLISRQVSAVCLLALLGLPAFAQQSTIIGHIADIRHKALQVVVVKAENPDTGATREVLTNAQGDFQLSLPAAGRYRLEAVKPGYEPLFERDINVSPGRATTVDLQMKVAALSERVTFDGRLSDDGSLLIQDRGGPSPVSCPMLKIAAALLLP